MDEDKANASFPPACFIPPTDKLSLRFEIVSVNVTLLENRFGYI